MKSGKNCPWCGYDDIKVVTPEQQPPVNSHYGAGYVAECINCGSRGPSGMANATEAVRAWVHGINYYREVNERGLVPVDPTQLTLNGDPQVVNQQMNTMPSPAAYLPQATQSLEGTTTVDKDGVFYHLSNDNASVLLQTTREIVTSEGVGKEMPDFDFNNVTSITVSPCGLWTTIRHPDAAEDDPIQGEENGWSQDEALDQRMFDNTKMEIQRLQSRITLPDINWDRVYFITVNEEGFKLEDERTEMPVA